jgi:hypothetical protein
MPAYSNHRGWRPPGQVLVLCRRRRHPGVAPAPRFEIAMALVDLAAVSHWSAIHHHGLTEQVRAKVFVLTTSETSIPWTGGAKAGQARDRYLVDGMVHQLIQITPERFFGVEKIGIGGVRLTVTEPQRSRSVPIVGRAELAETQPVVIRDPSGLRSVSSPSRVRSYRGRGGSRGHRPVDFRRGACGTGGEVFLATTNSGGASG